MTARSLTFKQPEYGPFDLTLMDNRYDPTGVNSPAFTTSIRGRTRGVQAPRSRLSESSESRRDAGHSNSPSGTMARNTPATKVPSPTLTPIIVTPESYPRPWVPQNSPRQSSSRRRDADTSDTQGSVSRASLASGDEPMSTAGSIISRSATHLIRASTDDDELLVRPYPFHGFDAVPTLASLDSQVLRPAEKSALISALRTQRINTIAELRRAERLLIRSDPVEVTEPMTIAWTNYVNSHNLLHELRALTRTYPFSSECLDEAKTLILNDQTSAKSWNFCWLVLMKIRQGRLLPKHADELARRPSTWGGREPSQSEIERLVAACVEEWTRAFNHMLGHWRDGAPSIPGTGEAPITNVTGGEDEEQTTEADDEDNEASDEDVGDDQTMTTEDDENVDADADDEEEETQRAP